MTKYPTFGEYLKAEYNGPYSATDALIRTHIIDSQTQRPKYGVVLIDRKYEPANKLAIPGGIGENITLSENARKEAFEETGLYTILDEPNRPFRLLSDPTMDPRVHMSAPVYTMRGFGTLKPQDDEDAKNAKVYTIAELTEMVEKPELWAFPHHHRFYVSEFLKEHKQLETQYGKKPFKKTGLIGRFKPLHNGGAKMLTYAALHSEHLVIGIGSANKYNLRNPFTADETQGMIENFLTTLQDRGFEFKYEIHHLNDFAHDPKYADGQKWKGQVLEKFGDLDTLVSGNAFVKDLLSTEYDVMHPSKLIPKSEHEKLNATTVRKALAIGTIRDDLGVEQVVDWKTLVPPCVAAYMTEHKLDTRFKTEFGERASIEYAKDTLVQTDVVEEQKFAQES
jgi:nicotinamide mononucleotide adenylyltransferase/ADP-ribose pyrophosphatase YjhB (NUDIX family)